MGEWHQQHWAPPNLTTGMRATTLRKLVSATVGLAFRVFGPPRLTATEKAVLSSGLATLYLTRDSYLLAGLPGHPNREVV